MNRLNMKTLDDVEQNIDLIAELFPDCVRNIKNEGRRMWIHE